jgi:GntR family transcriptional regulator/MocR family aminotransferase
MRAVRADAMASVGQIDPRGHPELRTQIASYLAIARGLQCDPDQIILTSGYRSGLAMVIRALRLQGRPVWIEEPGYPFTKKGLELDGMKLVPVPVDDEGIDIDEGIRACQDAALVVVTPGQQAPTGVALSPARRVALLNWAAKSGAWIIEDDYLSELQLSGRAMPALASEVGGDRVVHIGSFGKTMSPALGLGFVVAPLELVTCFWQVATYLQPAPNTTTQLAFAGFMADGHYLRHLRHMKALYSERRDALRDRLGQKIAIEAMSGLAIKIRLPHRIDDVALARSVLPRGIAPMPLSLWWSASDRREPGFLLGVTNLCPKILDRACTTLENAIGPL